MKKMIFIAVLAMAGCATEPAKTWNKPGSTQTEFNMDQGNCRAQAFSVGYGATTPLAITQQRVIIFESCMYGKGWELR